MLSVNFKPKRTAAVSRGFLATAWLSCIGLYKYKNETNKKSLNVAISISLYLVQVTVCFLLCYGVNYSNYCMHALVTCLPVLAVVLAMFFHILNNCVLVT